MGTLYKTIIDLCESKGIKGGKLCTDLGISKGLLSDLKMGRRSGVSAVTAQKIAAYLGVSVGYLLGEEDAPETKKEQTAFSDLPESKQALMQFVQSVPEDKADMILRVMKSILESD
jgi:transcriptional regulator with XRE-family HTH domain